MPVDKSDGLCSTDDWVISVVDTIPKRWPGVSQLVSVGVPVKYAERYRKVRWAFTAGLRRRVKVERN